MGLAQLTVSGGLDDPLPVLHDAIEAAHRDRMWLQLWMQVAALAAWWASHQRTDAAAVVVGHLDVHHLGGYGYDTLATARAAVETQPNATANLARGRALDRDQLIDYVLSELAITPGPSKDTLD